MTVLTLKQCRPDQEETEYFWKLFHAAQRNDARWHGSEISIIADELSRTNLDRNQKLFLLRAWQVLVDDKGGFGRFMGAFDTYVYNMQDPDDDCVAWKPELAKLLQNGDLFDVVLHAYQEARHDGIVNWEAAASLSEENEDLKRKLEAAKQDSVRWLKVFEKAVSVGARYEERIAELEARTLPPLNDDLVAILGRPNFTCAHLAELLRKSGEDIRRKSEFEQAAVIHWFLRLYLEHGDQWKNVAKADIQSRAAAAGIGKEE